MSELFPKYHSALNHSVIWIFGQNSPKISSKLRSELQPWEMAPEGLVQPVRVVSHIHQDYITLLFLNRNNPFLFFRSTFTKGLGFFSIFNSDRINTDTVFRSKTTSSAFVFDKKINKTAKNQLLCAYFIIFQRTLLFFPIKQILHFELPRPIHKWDYRRTNSC
ncbi:MAG: hypothetical protein WD708_00275 [Kiritimatiellia bacterium]